MSIQLKLDEMLEIIQVRIDPQMGAAYEKVLCGLADNMAELIVNAVNAKGGFIEHGYSTMQGVAFAGLCAPFSPMNEEDPGPVPEILEGYDDEGWE